MGYHAAMKGHASTLNLRHSRRLTWAIVVMHAMAGCAVVLAGLSWAARLPFLVAIGIGLFASTRHSDTLSVRAQADGGLAVRAGDDWVPASVSADSMVLSWAIVLRLRLEGRRRMETRVILPDSLETEEFRRFRVWLKWRASVAGAVKPVA
jgi:hypothetical protein